MENSPVRTNKIVGTSGVHCPLKAPNALLADFIQYTAQHAAANGTPVDPDMLRRIAQEFLRVHPLTAFSFQECRRLRDEASGQTLPPFERIVSEPLTSLFPRFAEAPDGHASLSRRVLPGLACAVSAMLGQDRADDLNRRAEAIYAEHLDAATGAPDWAAIVADLRARAIGIEVELIMIGHFREFERRLDWLVAIVEAHMPAAATVSERMWRFSRRQALTMIAALTRPLRDLIAERGITALPADRAVSDAAIRTFFADLAAATERGA